MFQLILFGVVPAVLVVGAALALAASGRPIFWDSWIKRTAAQMHTLGLALAAVIAAGLWGLSALTSTWPLWASFWLSRKLSEIGLDVLARFGLLPASPMTRPTRLIEHANGGRALVDATTGKGYQRLPDSDPSSLIAHRSSFLTRWLNEKV